jgi:hypothetical protein
VKFNLQKLLEDPSAAVATRAKVVDEFEVRTFLHALLFETGFNATEAYLKIRPRSTRKTAATSGSELARRPETQRLALEIASAAWQRQEIDRDYIIGCWVALARGNVYDYFDEDAAGHLVLRKKSDLPFEIQRNVKKIKVTTRSFREQPGVTEQRIELELHSRQDALDSLARAGGLFGDFGEDSSDDVAKAIEEGFARVARSVSSNRTLQGEAVQEGVILAEGERAR